jgi:hypothetical protein
MSSCQEESGVAGVKEAPGPAGLRPAGVGALSPPQSELCHTAFLHHSEAEETPSWTRKSPRILELLSSCNS